MVLQSPLLWMLQHGTGNRSTTNRVGEVVCRIIGKVMLQVVRQDVLEVTDTDQLCAGQPGGYEAAIHAIRHLFGTPECEAVLLADAQNAFNSLNRAAALLNACA